MMYMNTMTGEIIDEESFDELVDEEMEMWLDECNFERWINEHYSAYEIFSMYESDRQEVYEEFYDTMREKAIENMDYEPAEEEE